MSRTNRSDASGWAHGETGFDATSLSYDMLTTNLVKDLRGVEAKVHRDQVLYSVLTN